MSMLGEQIKELWRMADELDEHSAFIGYCGSVSRDPYIRDAAVMLREAADTIIGLRDRLQELQGVTGESRYTALFGTPEKAARTLAGKCSDCFECVLENACEQGSGEGCLLSDESNFDALLEWLKQEVDA